MKLSSYLESNLIFFNVGKNTQSKEDIIYEMVDRISKYDKSFRRSKKGIYDALIEKENIFSGAVGHKTFIPHLRTELYNDVLVAIGILDKGIPCTLPTGSEDVFEVIFMIIVPESKSRVMLGMLGAISGLISQKEFLSSISTFTSSEQVLSYILKNEIEVEDEILAEHIMRKILPISLEENVRSFAKRLAAENLSSIPVVNSKDEFVGQITNKELIKLGMPAITSVLRNMSFLRHGEPFEEYFKNEKIVKVSDIYRKRAVTVDRKASIMEVAFLMLQRGTPRIYVVEGNKYYGTISRRDIVEKVLHL